MRKTVDIEAGRVARLAKDLLPVFRERGALVQRIANVENVDRWRAAARKAGHDLGWRVRTGVSNDGSTVWAVSDDYEPPPGSERRAVEVIGRALRNEAD